MNLDFNNLPSELLKAMPEQLYGLPPTPRKYLYDNDHRFIVVSAGRRAWKSLLGKRKVDIKAVTTPGLRLFKAAPTRQQAKDIFWEDLKNDLKLFIKDKNETDMWVKLYNGSMIKVVSLEAIQRIEGQSWDGCHITELPDAKPGTWNAISIMLSEKNKKTGKRGFAILDGVPDMTNGEHRDLAFYACDGAMPKTKPYFGAYKYSANDPEWAFYTWLSVDALGEKEVAKQRERLDIRTFRQEFEGSYETIEGVAYYGYTGDYYPVGNLDTNIHYDSNLPIVMGFDFNVNPMTAVLGHIKKNKKGQQEYLLFKGYFLENSNTKQLIERILVEYPETRTFFLTPCQSSINRQTSADLGVTDLRIIRTACMEAKRNLHVRKRTKNPLQKDRVAATNSMLYHNKLRINPKDKILNKFLVKDWEGRVWKEGTTTLDDSLDKMKMGHISAACDYVCERYWPIRIIGQQDIMNEMII